MLSTRGCSTVNRSSSAAAATCLILHASTYYPRALQFIGSNSWNDRAITIHRLRKLKDSHVQIIYIRP